MIKILTLNMHKGFSIFNRRFILHQLRDAVRASNADVVLLQEVLGEHRDLSAVWKDWPQHSQYEFLADSIWPAHAYGKNAVYPAGHHGNAIMSKFPITHWENHDLSLRSQERRGVLHCIVSVPRWQQSLHIVCTHLALFEHHRRRQLELVRDYVERRIPAHEPLLLGGDFNDWRGYAHRFLARTTRLREVFISTNGRAARTFPVHFPLLRLDRLYFRNLDIAYPRIHSRRPWTRLSDHAPLSVEVRA